MVLPIVTPAPVVVSHGDVFRDLFDNQREFRHWLLLDFGVVKLGMLYNPVFVVFSSLRLLFFKGLKSRLSSLSPIEVEDPGIQQERYPITDMFQRTLRFQADDTPEQRLKKLEQELRQYRLPLEESVPLFAMLLSLPMPEDWYAPLTWTPQRQRQKTLESIVSILLE